MVLVGLDPFYAASPEYPTITEVYSELYSSSYCIPMSPRARLGHWQWSLPFPTVSTNMDGNRRRRIYSGGVRAEDG
jgi:hypothetical protein